MDKEQEILNMLEYLALRHEYPNPVSKRSDGVFNINFFISNSNLPLRDKLPDCDCNSFILDFNLKQIKVYSYDDSYHNGDHYNCSDKILDWSYLSKGYDFLKSKVENSALKEVRIKAELYARDSMVKDILNGKK